MFRILAKALPLSLAVLFPLGVSAQRPPLGPLSAEEGAPLQRLGYTPMVEAAAPVGVGTLRTEMWIGYTNLFEQDSTADHVLYLDMERMVTAVTVRYGLAEDVEVGGRLSLHSSWGGFLDGAMVGFHRLLGLGVRERPFHPEGAYRDVLRDGGGRTLAEVPERHLALDDVRLFAKWGMLAGPHGAGSLSVRAVARIPTSQPTVGSERADVGLMLLGNVAWRGVHLHAMAGGSSVRRGADMLDVLRGRQWFGMVGVERPLREGLSGVVEWTASTSLVRDFDDHDVDGAPMNVVFGLVGVTGSDWRWEAALQEDCPPRGPSLDFTLQLALARSW